MYSNVVTIYNYHIKTSKVLSLKSKHKVIIMKLFHYSAKPFEVIDMTKCDGFWMTTIKPEQTELLNDVGASGSSWVAVCELDADNLEVADGNTNYDVEDFMAQQTDADYQICRYDGFADYAVVNPTHVKIIEWIKL